MADTATKVPAKTEEKAAERPSAPRAWRPFEGLRQEVDRLFADFDRDLLGFPAPRRAFSFEPLWRDVGWAGAPAVDVVEKDGAYEITAELPGMDEKNIELKLLDGELILKGEKQEETEEKQQGYHLHERRFGAFERHFAVPEGVDRDKIAATFNKGVLKVALPKKPEARKPEKQIEVKAA